VEGRGQVGAEVDGVEHGIDVGVGIMRGVELVLSEVWNLCW
jgi:hypothetical protein